MMTAVVIAALKVEDVVLLKQALQLLEGPPPSEALRTYPHGNPQA